MRHSAALGLWAGVRAEAIVAPAPMSRPIGSSPSMLLFSCHHGRHAPGRAPRQDLDRAAAVGEGEAHGALGGEDRAPLVAALVLPHARAVVEALHALQRRAQGQREWLDRAGQARLTGRQRADRRGADVVDRLDIAPREEAADEQPAARPKADDGAGRQPPARALRWPSGPARCTGRGSADEGEHPPARRRPRPPRTRSPCGRRSCAGRRGRRPARGPHADALEGVVERLDLLGRDALIGPAEEAQHRTGEPGRRTRSAGRGWRLGPGGP